MGAPRAPRAAGPGAVRPGGDRGQRAQRRRREALAVGGDGPPHPPARAPLAERAGLHRAARHAPDRDRAAAAAHDHRRLSGRAAATPETRSIAAHGALRDGRTRANTAKPPPERPVQTATARPAALTATSGVRGSPLRGRHHLGRADRRGGRGAGLGGGDGREGGGEQGGARAGGAQVGSPRRDEAVAHANPAGLREREGGRGTEPLSERVLTRRPDPEPGGFRMRPRAVRTPLVALLLVAVAVAVVAAIASSATSPAIQTSTPTSEKQITNIDVLRQQIRNYYGDPLGTGVVRRPTATTPRRRESVAAAGGALARRAAPSTRRRTQGDPARRRRHLAGHLELRDLQQLGVQPDDERRLRHRPAVPGRAGHGRPGRRPPSARATRSSS